MFVKIREKGKRAVIRAYSGDLGVNQAAEVGGLVGVAVAVTAGVATKGDQIGGAIATFFQNKFG